MRLSERDKDTFMLERLLAINDKSFAENERASREKFTEHFKNDDVFVNDDLCPTAFAFVTDRDGPYIVVIAVVSGLRKNGLGAKLLKDIEDFYRLGDEVEIKLTCSTENWQAQRLYLKMGYRPVRVIQKYYTTEDGLLMRRILWKRP